VAPVVVAVATEPETLSRFRPSDIQSDTYLPNVVFLRALARWSRDEPLKSGAQESFGNTMLLLSKCWLSSLSECVCIMSNCGKILMRDLAFGHLHTVL
jgi:hypothetical protein